MFLLMGIGSENELMDEISIICDTCGKYGRINIVLQYNYFSLFFIKLFKFSKHYSFYTTCCNQAVEISANSLNKYLHEGYELTKEDFIFDANASCFCPNCGASDFEPGNFCKNCGVALRQP